MEKVLFSLALGAVCLTMSPVNATAETTIRVTLQLPATHSLGQNWLAFKEIIEKESGGDLKLQLFPSAQLFKDKQVPEAVGSGAVDAGSAFLGRFAGSVPAVEIVNLPFFFRDEAHLRAAAANGSTMRNILDAAVLKETGARVLWWQAFGRNIYLNKGKPIRTPADLKGKKVRTYGKVLGMTGASAVKSRKLYESIAAANKL